MIRVWCVATASKLRHQWFTSFAVILYFVFLRFPIMERERERAILSDWRLRCYCGWWKPVSEVLGLSTICIDI